MGFGFRGSSPPWPYVGLGRGGLPRCGYFLWGPGMPPAGAYRQPPYPAYGRPAFGPSGSPVTREEELGFLKDQAQALKEHLAQIEARIEELAGKE